MSDYKPAYTQDDGEQCESTEAIIVRVSSRYGLTREESLELIEDVQEHFPSRNSAALSEFWKLRSLIERGVRAVRVYVVKNKGSQELAEGCLWMLLGFNSLAHADTMSEFARRLGMSKQRVNKCMRHLQSLVPELPELDGQREADSVEKMRAAQKQIWHKKKL